jgi:hypothetical protein
MGRSGGRGRAVRAPLTMDDVHGSAFARCSGTFMSNAPGGDMATRDTTNTGGPSDSTIEQSAQAVGNIIETGATVVGRGLAAGVEGSAQLADRAAQMTGMTSPRAIGNAAENAARSTMTAARSAARTTRSAARSTATAASRTAGMARAKSRGRATRAATRTAKPAAKRSTKRPAKRATKASVKRAMKASAQKGRRKVSQSKSMLSKRTGAKSGRSRKRR